MAEVLSNFDIGLEENRAHALDNIVSFEQYRFKRDAMVSYNKDQMIKGLGERFHVVISRYEYDIRDDKLWGKDMDEPAIDSFMRGRDHRLEHGNPVDFQREESEVRGFEKMQKIMAADTTPVETTVMSISQPGLEGTTYNDNFIDFHTKKIDENGRVYVQSQRVSSGLTMEESIKKISAFAQIEIDGNDPAASLLENPIAIDSSMTVDDLVFYMYKDHDYMDERTFRAIVGSVSHLVNAYAESVVKNPDDKNYHRLIANTILNKADEALEDIKIYGVEALEKIMPITTPYHIEREIEDYGHREVREIMAGCGRSGGFEVDGKETAQSVADFDPNKKRILCCTCPFCQEKVEAEISGGRISCPSCKKTAKWSN